MNMRNTILGIIVIIIIAGGGYFAWKFLGNRNVTPLSTASYSCDTGKTIDASFYDKSVKITLSDGRDFSLPQVLSNTGALYTNAEKSIEFTSNDDGTAHIGEGSSDIQTYSNCVAAGSQAATVSTYASTAGSSTPAFTIKYPKAFTLNTGYTYTAFGPKKPIAGVQFVIPAAMATGTNLSSDSGVSVEWLPNAKKCTGDIFVQANVKAQSINDNGVQYSVATSSDAGAGNLYEEIVYALPDSKPCTAVRYFIHSTQIANYPAGAVQAFDETALVVQFDKIRQSLVLGS